MNYDKQEMWVNSMGGLIDQCRVEMGLTATTGPAVRRQRKALKVFFLKAHEIAIENYEAACVAYVAGKQEELK